MHNQESNLNQCEYMYTFRNGECIHLNILPFTWYNLFSYFLIQLILGISSVGGLGGGIEKIPILILMLNYPQKQATLYVYPLTFGINICNFLLLLYQKHPILNKQIIDYDLSLILLPTVLIGSAFGGMLNKVIPDVILISILMLFMLIFIPDLLGKAQKEKKKDDDHLDKMINRIESDNSQFNYYKRQDEQLIPITKFGLLFILFFIIEIIVIIRGSKEQLSLFGIEYCSIFYWLFSLLILFLLLIVSYYIKQYLSRIEYEQKQIGYFLEGVHNHYDWTNYITVWIAGFLGGIMGGMTGVGAGAIIMSVLLLKGINSRVASATAGFQKLFIAIFTTLIAYQQGYLNKFEILFFTILGIVGGLVVAGPIYYYVLISGKQYLIIYIVVILLFMNFLSGIGYLVREISIFSHWNLISEWKSFC